MPRKKTSTTTAVLNSSEQTFTLDDPNSFFAKWIGGISRDLSPQEAYANVIPIRAAVTAIVNNACKARTRIFDASGSEVIGGKLFDLINHPYKNYSQHTYKRELFSWLLIAGEFAVKLIAGDFKGSSAPVGMYPLDPFKLQVLEPAIPKTIQDVQLWQYQWGNGVIEQLRSDHVVYEKSFNPGIAVRGHSSRGLSPITSGGNEVNSFYQAGRWAKQFFENNAQPASLYVLPEGVSRKEKEKFQAELFSAHSTLEGKAWKDMVVSGGAVEVKPLSTDVDKIHLNELLQHDSQMLFTLYQVPPIVSGDFANAKYDSAAEQLTSFLDNTLIPLLDLASHAHQVQLVERFDWSDGVVTNKAPDLNRTIKNSLDDALDTGGGAKHFILFDPSTMPAYAALQAQKFKALKELRNAVFFSPAEAAEWLDVDLPEDRDGVRDDIWVDTASGPVNLSAVKRMGLEQPSPSVPGSTAPAMQNPQPQLPAPKETTQNADEPADSQLASKISRLFNDLRGYALNQIENSLPILLREFDAIGKEVGIENMVLKARLRHLYSELQTVKRENSEVEGRVSAAKGVFNQIKKSECKSLAGLIRRQAHGTQNIVE